MEHCENCDCEFEHDTDNAWHYKQTGSALCSKCLAHYEAMQELQAEYLRETER